MRVLGWLTQTTVAAGSIFKGGHITAGHGAGSAGEIPQDFFQGKNLLFGQKHSVLQMASRFMPKSFGLVDHRFPTHIEFKAEWSTAVQGPRTKGLAGDSTNDLRSVSHIVKALAGLLIN